MKNTVFVLSACLFSCFTWAQSTCETRVDAHQRASTMQRVHYCLTPDEQAVSNPGLVFSGVSSPRPSATYVPDVEDEQTLAKSGSFKPEEVGIAKVFVETRRFPKLSDGRVSQQEILAKQQALQEGRALAQEASSQNECILPDELAEEVTADVQTLSAPQTRSAKPVRKTSKKKKTTKTASAKVKKTVKPVEEEVYTAFDTASYGQELPGGKEIPVGTSSYAPAVSGEEIPVGTASYAPASSGVGEYDEYDVYGQEEIPVGTASYAPAN